MLSSVNKDQAMRINFVLLALCTSLIMSCSSDYDYWNNRCEIPRGNIVTVGFDIPVVDEISLEDNLKVVLRYGSYFEVVAEGSSNLIDLLEFRVSGDHVSIRTRRCISSTNDLVVYITVPYIEEINNYGSGVIYSENTLWSDDLDIELNGSGVIDLALDVEDLDAEIIGSGSLIAEGRGEELDLIIEGSGVFRGFDISFDEAEVESYGSGSAMIRVRDELKVRILGSGSVYFRGFPELYTNIEGSGGVFDAN